MTLSDIQQSFYTRTFEFQAVSSWLTGIAVICVLLAACLAFRAIRVRRMRYKLYGSVMDPQIVRKILREAFDQRRPFEVQVQTDSSQHRPTLRCSPEYLGQKSFTVEISGLKSLSDRWLGRAVTVFFRVQAGKDFTYYTFPSSIEGIHLPRQGICHITLPIPNNLENRQKRSFLRISPPKEFLLGSAIWYSETMPTTERLNDISVWPRPKLLLIPGRMEQYKLADVSAGGMRIQVPNDVIRSAKLQFNSSEHLMVMLDLFDPEQSRRLRFWMDCRIQNVWLEHSSHDVSMGVQFKAWARPKESLDQGEANTGIEWLRLSSASEIEPLGNWIMRRHLEMFRDNPGAPE